MVGTALARLCPLYKLRAAAALVRNAERFQFTYQTTKEKGVRPHSRGANCVRVLLQVTLWIERGRRECRVLAAPMARLQNKKQAAVTTGSAETSGIPCAMALRLTSYSPRGAGLVCPRRQRDHPSRLDTSVGVSGPYDLVVRLGAVRPHEDIARVAKASIASPPHVLVTIARPSLFHRGGMPGEEHIFLKNGIRIFLRGGLDIGLSLELPHEIRFFAHATWLRKAAAATRNDHRFTRPATSRRLASARIAADSLIPGAARIAGRRAPCSGARCGCMAIQSPRWTSEPFACRKSHGSPRILQESRYAADRTDQAKRTMLPALRRAAPPCTKPARPQNGSYGPAPGLCVRRGSLARRPLNWRRVQRRHR